MDQFSHLDDNEFLRIAFKGDEDAISFIGLIHEIVHTWDDLIDEDFVVPDRVNSAFFSALVGIPGNRFFAEHRAVLIPIIAAGCMNYEIANSFEDTGCESDIDIAYTIRYSIADVAVHVALIIGGREWVSIVGPEIRRRSQRDSIVSYRKEIEAKNEKKAKERTEV